MATSLHEGHLERKGTGRFPWGSRVAVLYADKLVLFKNDKGAKKGPPGEAEIALSAMKTVVAVDDKKTARFVITLTDGTESIFKLKKSAERDEWVTQLNKAMPKPEPAAADAPEDGAAAAAAPAGAEVAPEAAAVVPAAAEAEPEKKKGFGGKLKGAAGNVAVKTKSVATTAVTKVKDTGAAVVDKSKEAALVAASAGKSAAENAKETALALKEALIQFIQHYIYMIFYDIKINGALSQGAGSGKAWVEKYIESAMPQPNFTYPERPNFEAAKQQCLAEVQAIIAAHQGSAYDDGFSMERMLCVHEDDLKTVEFPMPDAYKRAKDVLSDPYLCHDEGLSAGNIVQGGLGTCWLLSSLAVLCSDETGAKFVRDIICAYDAEVGVFGIVLFINGAWRPVIVDDRLPVYGDKDYLLFAQSTKPSTEQTDGRRSTNDMVWVALMEKAYARCYGCYYHVDGGFDRYALTDLTGGANMCYTLDGGPSKTGLSPSFAGWKGKRIVNRWNKSYVTYGESMRLCFHEGTIEGSGETVIVDTKSEGASTSAQSARAYSVEGTLDFYGNVKLTQTYDDGSAEVTWEGQFDAEKFKMHGTFFTNLEEKEVEEGKLAKLKNAMPSVSLDDQLGLWELTVTADVATMGAALNPFSTLWDLMAQYMTEGARMSCSLDDPPGVQEGVRPDGLITGHAYGITKIVTLADGTKLVRARNPHGHGEFMGRWGDESEEFQAKKDELFGLDGYEAGDDGTFHMLYEDWHKLFDSLDVCRPKIFPAVVQKKGFFKKDFVGGTTAWYTNPQYRFFPSASGKYIVQIAQPNTKLHSPHDDYPIGVGAFIVAPRGRPGRLTTTNHVIIGKIEPVEFEREGVVEVYVEKTSSPYFIIPVASETNVEVPYLLTVHSEQDFILQDAETPQTNAALPLGGLWAGAVEVNNAELQNIPDGTKKLIGVSPTSAGPPSIADKVNLLIGVKAAETAWTDTEFKANDGTSILYEFNEPVWFAGFLGNLVLHPKAPKEPKPPSAPTPTAVTDPEDPEHVAAVEQQNIDAQNNYEAQKAAYEQKLAEYHAAVERYNAEMAYIKGGDPLEIVITSWATLDAPPVEVHRYTVSEENLSVRKLAFEPYCRLGVKGVLAGSNGGNLEDITFAQRWEVKIVQNGGGDHVSLTKLHAFVAPREGGVDCHYGLSLGDAWSAEGRQKKAKQIADGVPSLGSTIALQIDQDGSVFGDGLYCGRMFQTGGAAQLDGSMKFFRSEVTVDGIYGNTTDTFTYDGKYNASTGMIEGTWSYGRETPPNASLSAYSLQCLQAAVNVIKSTPLLPNSKKTEEEANDPDPPPTTAVATGTFSLKRLEAHSSCPPSGTWLYRNDKKVCMMTLCFSKYGHVYGTGGEDVSANEITGAWDDGRVFFRSLPGLSKANECPLNFAGEYDGAESVMHGVTMTTDHEDYSANVNCNKTSLMFVPETCCTSSFVESVVVQPLYECTTCSGTERVVVCAGCLETCHADHDAAWYYPQFNQVVNKCMCGEGKGRRMCCAAAPSPPLAEKVGVFAAGAGMPEMSMVLASDVAGVQNSSQAMRWRLRAAQKASNMLFGGVSNAMSFQHIMEQFGDVALEQAKFALASARSEEENQPSKLTNPKDVGSETYSAVEDNMTWSKSTDLTFVETSKIVEDPPVVDPTPWDDVCSSWYKDVKPTNATSSEKPSEADAFLLALLEELNMSLSVPLPASELPVVAKTLIDQGLTVEGIDSWTVEQWRALDGGVSHDVRDALIEYSEPTVLDLLAASAAKKDTWTTEFLDIQVESLDLYGVDDFGTEFREYGNEDWEELELVDPDVREALKAHFAGAIVNDMEDGALDSGNLVMQGLLRDVSFAASLSWDDALVEAQASALVSAGIVVAEDLGTRGLASVAGVEDTVLAALKKHVTGEGEDGLLAAIAAANESLDPAKTEEELAAFEEALKGSDVPCETVRQLCYLSQDDWAKIDALDADLSAALRSICGELPPLRLFLGILGLEDADAVWKSMVEADIDSVDDLLVMSPEQLDASSLPEHVVARLKESVVEYTRPAPEGFKKGAVQVDITNVPLTLRRLAWSRQIFITPREPVKATLKWKISGTAKGSRTKTQSMNPTKFRKVQWKDSAKPLSFQIGKTGAGSVVLSFESTNPYKLQAPEDLIIADVEEGADPVDTSDPSVTAIIRTLRPAWPLDMVEDTVAGLVEYGIKTGEDLVNMTEELWDDLAIDEELADALCNFTQLVKSTFVPREVVEEEEEEDDEDDAELAGASAENGIDMKNILTGDADLAHEEPLSQLNAHTVTTLARVRTRQEGVWTTLAAADELTCRHVIVSLNVLALRRKRAEPTIVASMADARKQRTGESATPAAERRSRARNVRRARSQAVRRARTQNVRRARGKAVRRCRANNVRRARSQHVRRARSHGVRRTRSRNVRRARSRAVRRARSKCVRRARSSQVRRARSKAVRRARSKAVRRARATAPTRDS